MLIKPYGDTLHDGKVQLSFSLPLADGALGIATAKEIARKMNMPNPEVVHHEPIGDEFSFYVLYGSITTEIETEHVPVIESSAPKMSMAEVEDLIAEKLQREIVFVGASTGTDAHTVGIDAIMNMKGYAGHYGLERYKGVKAYNLGSQVQNAQLIRKALEVNADVLLISQTVTQKEVHLRNMVELVELLEAEGLRERFILICGGARISHELAKELGYDAGFGPGKYAVDVAAFAINELIAREQTAK